MRPALQPWLAAGLFKGLGALGLFTPIVAAFLLRVGSGLLALWISLELCIRTLPSVRDASLKRLLLPGMLFLWFLPYIHGRFASENWGGLLFFAGLCFVLDAGDSPDRRRSSVRFALVGLLWAAAFYCRFQVGLAIAGAGAWLLVVDRAPLRSIGALAVSFLAACALNVVLDHWLYGEWVFTPYNYLYTNLVEGKAATFGTQPWWFYLAQMLALLVPPFSLLLVGVLVASVWSCRKNVFVWVVVPFVIGTTCSATRKLDSWFRSPYAIVPLLVLGADRLPEALRAKIARWPNPRAAAAAVRVFVALNLFALAVMTFKPSSETAVVYERLYRGKPERADGALHRIAPAVFHGGQCCQFLPPGERDREAPGRRLRTARRDVCKPQGRVYFFQQSLQAPDWMAAARIACTPVARTLPLWARRFNLNNWMGKMYQWSVFLGQHRRRYRRVLARRQGAACRGLHSSPARAPASAAASRWRSPRAGYPSCSPAGAANRSRRRRAQASAAGAATLVGADRRHAIAMPSRALFARDEGHVRAARSAVQQRRHRRARRARSRS